MLRNSRQVKPGRAWHVLTPLFWSHYLALRQGPGKDTQPASGDFFIRPVLYLLYINSNHDVVIHDGIGTQINREHLTEQFDAVDDPLAAVFEVKAGVGILATQKFAPHTSGDAVVVGRVFQ